MDYGLRKLIRNVINSLEHNKYDAFPSLHAAITLATLIIMGQYRKNWLYVFIPVIHWNFYFIRILQISLCH